jgi:hypothetical protein
LAVESHVRVARENLEPGNLRDLLCFRRQARGKAQHDRKECAPAQCKGRRAAATFGIGRPAG